MSANEFTTGRETCLQCFRASTLCLCSLFTPFKIEPLIVLVVHPKEFLRTVGTVRIVKRSLTNSILWRGRGPDFDCDTKMQSLLRNPALFPMVLFPGEDSLNLTVETEEAIRNKIPKNRTLALFVIDGTWTTAKQIIRMSKTLSILPKISFTVNTPSNYKFRKQPQEFCLSTVEAVSLLIENMYVKGLCRPIPERAHLEMLKPFHNMVNSQLTREALENVRRQPKD